MKTLQFTVTLVAVVWALDAGIADAATYYFKPSGATADWSSANWKAGNSCTDITGDGSVPSATVDAVICENKVAAVTNTSAVARTVTVEGGTAAIEIKPDSSLAAIMTIGTSGGELTSTLAGGGDRIKLLKPPSGSNIATLAIDSADHTIEQNGQGNATIVGDDDAALITIASEKTLTIRIGFVEGRLKIVSPNGGNGKLVADTYFNANDINGGTLLIAPYGLDDSTGTSYVADIGTLEFGSAITTVTDPDGKLAGEILATFSTATVLVNASTSLTTTGVLLLSYGGKLVVNQNLTMGSVEHACVITEGTIEVAAGKTFIHH